MEEQPKRKRVMTRIGDIFCVQMKDCKAYFQFIAVNSENLGGCVIRVFRKRYPLEYEFCAEEVVNDDVEFYAHTMPQTGLKEDAWTKVGKSKDVGDLEQVMFRHACFLPTLQNRKSNYWCVSGINKKWVRIGEMTEEYRNKTDPGSIFPPYMIVERIENGAYPMLEAL